MVIYHANFTCYYIILIKYVNIRGKEKIGQDTAIWEYIYYTRIMLYWG
jgi:hypothetical protein